MNLQYCYGCMETLSPGQIICPRCGYDNSYRYNDELFLPEGMVLNRKYLIGKVLGKGGFGITYLGLDLTLRNKVAIKEYFPGGLISRSGGNSIVRISLNKDVRDIYYKNMMAFQTEALALAMFNSPSVVRVRDFFHANNTAYIVMDYIDGLDLEDEINKCGGRIKWKRVISLFMPLIPELDRMHQKNLIHRDIKPGNIKIVVDSNTREERLVLLDFGAARNFSRYTMTYSQILTPGYAPYEQYQEKGHQGPYTDIYALCGTMYKAITGQKPPTAPDRMTKNDEHLRSIRSFNIDIPKAVEKPILHGLKKNIKDRPQSMQDLYLEFKKAISDIDLSNDESNLSPISAIIQDNDSDQSTIDDLKEKKQTTEKSRNRRTGKKEFLLVFILILLAVIITTVMYIKVLYYDEINKPKIPGENELATYAAETVDANSTSTAKVIPTETPTNTPEPTNTPLIILTHATAAGDIMDARPYKQDDNSEISKKTIPDRILVTYDNMSVQY